MGSSQAGEPWYVYILQCENGMLYTGIAKDVGKRFAEHANGKGAKFTRINPPLAILASQIQPSHSAAAIVEASIKKLGKPEKLRWIAACKHRKRRVSRQPPTPR